MKPAILFTATGLLAITLAATSAVFAQTTSAPAATRTMAPIITSGSISQATENFIQKAAIGGKFEIDTSKLALDKSQNAVIKEFANRMIKDHGNTNDKFKNVLGAAQINLSVMPTALDMDHMKTFNELGRLKGTDFDQQYIADQINAHNEAVSLFENYAKNGDNPTLRNFAIDTLPTLRDHAQQIQDIKLSSR